MGKYKFTRKDTLDNWEKIRFNLKLARVNAGLTQKEVAAYKIVTQSDISKIENGKLKIDIMTLTELAALYDEDLVSIIPALMLKWNYMVNRDDY